MSQSKKHNMAYIKEFCDYLKEKVYTKIAPLTGEAWVTPEPVSYKERTTGKHINLELNKTWGDLWDCAWMNFKGEVPKEGAGKKIVLLIDIAGEACLYDDNGNPIRGLTTRASDFDGELGGPVKRVLQFLPEAKGGEKVDIWLDAACNDLFGKYCENGVLLQADISICNEKIRHFYYDYFFLLNLCEKLEENTARRNHIEAGLLKAAKLCHTLSDDEVEEANAILTPLLEAKNAEDSFNLWAIGHAHIDLAWLWPIRETKRKGARTFSTALELMERYPDYHFGASQPQLYQWMKELHPELYRKIKEKVKEGRWECQGAMWVEPDMNLSGSEALVRQVLYGKKFFKEEFNKDMKVLWLPDVFGYSASLPQILQKSGVPYFMTIKLSWSEHNQFPHHTFLWKGIDGTEVLAHMPPEGNYNSSARPSALLFNEKNFKNKEESNDALLLFGIGDGGGGPGSEHLENLKREKSVAGLPSVKQRPAIEFFEHIEKDRPNLKKWSGELYLEKHQGTYTTQSNNKKYNRTIELKLRDCEFICSLARLYAQFDYAQEQIETLWKEALLYQFHDILPGSSIKRVYDESVARYKIMLNEVEEITENATKALAKSMNVKENEMLVFNTLPYERKVMVSDKVSATIPAYSWTLVNKKDIEVQETDVKVNKHLLENNLIRVELDENGNISSLFDKQMNREVLNKELHNNNLVIYEDNGDCWDIDFTYADKACELPKLISSEMIEKNGNTTVVFHYEYNKSKISQHITLSNNSKKLVYHTDVDWQETHRMMRVRFPMDIHTDEALCNIQFGYTKRPTHQNTSWDYARFEICAHKWVSLAENGYGAALINNCKYGFKVWDNVLDMDLLRSPMFPGIDADKGNHSFDYELMLHNGTVEEVNREGYLFNSPAVICNTTVSNGSLDTAKSFIEINHSNILTETLKLSEDKSGYIMRMYESEDRYTNAKIKVDGVKKVILTDMIEREIESIDVNNNTFELTFKPFEIHTVKLIFN